MYEKPLLGFVKLFLEMSHVFFTPFLWRTHTHREFVHIGQLKIYVSNAKNESQSHHCGSLLDDERSVVNYVLAKKKRSQNSTQHTLSPLKLTPISGRLFLCESKKEKKKQTKET